MKDIKDYLHLYKGQQGQYLKPKKQEWSEWKIVNGEFIHTVDLLDWKARLSLRPLSDMTEDEKRKWRSLMHKQYSGGAGHTGYLENPESFRYLLSKGFDLFGLIEAGLAIDKTTIEHEKKIS